MVVLLIARAAPESHSAEARAKFWRSGVWSVCTSEHTGAPFGGTVKRSPPRVRLSVTESVVLPPPTAVHHMPESYTRPEPSLLPIERPRCPKCQGRMMLARIEPGPNGSDLRTFECPKCEHVHQALVEDPFLKSANSGWVAGELKPPK